MLAEKVILNNISRLKRGMTNLSKTNNESTKVSRGAQMISSMKRKGPEVIADLKASNRATQMIPNLKLFTFGFVWRSLRPTILSTPALQISLQMGGGLDYL